MQLIYSTGQVARLLGLRPYQLEYAHASRQLAEPALRFIGKRVYCADDVRRVAEHFRLKLDESILNNNLEEATCDSNTLT
jgi:DNA-binding transcriptional MerR regulator